MARTLVTSTTGFVEIATVPIVMTIKKTIKGSTLFINNTATDTTAEAIPAEGAVGKQIEQRSSLSTRIKSSTAGWEIIVDDGT